MERSPNSSSPYMTKGALARWRKKYIVYGPVLSFVLHRSSPLFGRYWKLPRGILPEAHYMNTDHSLHVRKPNSAGPDGKLDWCRLRVGKYDVWAARSRGRDAYIGVPKVRVPHILLSPRRWHSYHRLIPQESYLPPTPNIHRYL